MAYDVAAIKFRGMDAVTNFGVSRYNLETISAIDFRNEYSCVENWRRNFIEQAIVIMWSRTNIFEDNASLSFDKTFKLLGLSLKLVGPLC